MDESAKGTDGRPDSKQTNLGDVQSYVPGSKVMFFWGGMVIPHRESLCWVYKPYYWVYKPYYWVDDHPLLYGNNRSLDLSTYINFNTFLFCSFAILQNIHHAFSTEVLPCSAVGMCRDAYLEVTAASTWRLLAVRVAGSRWLSVVDGRCTLFPSREGTPPQDATGEETASWNYLWKFLRS